MRAILPFLAGLMLVLTAFTVGAHAAERPPAPEAGAPRLVQPADMADGQDTGGKALVHQHGCHGHFLDVARVPACPGRTPALRHVPPPDRARVFASGAPRPHLRPPQA